MSMGREPPEAGVELPDAGVELPDAGVELPNAGVELPDVPEWVNGALDEPSDAVHAASAPGVHRPGRRSTRRRVVLALAAVVGLGVIAAVILGLWAGAHLHGAPGA
jgi:hypothetical protein